MRITIDTKEDSVHEIQHIISLLQQILARNHHTPHSAQMGLYQEYGQGFPPSSCATPHMPSTQAPPPPTPLSMFDVPEAPSVLPSYPGSSVTGLPSMSSASSLPIGPTQERPQSEQQPPQTPSIFDIFGSSADTSTKSATARETANDLLNYDREHDDSDYNSSTYTFTTY